jgi:PEP-CTERM motif
MKLTRGLALALLVACAPLAAFAGSVIIDNHDGTFTSTSAQNSLSLMGPGASMLFGVSGLGSGYDCAGLTGLGSCSGTVTLQTGTIIAGGTGTTLTPKTGQNTWLGGGVGTSFDVTENAAKGLNGFTFSGQFDTTPGANQWSCVGTCTVTVAHGVTTAVGSWQLSASIVNGVLTIGGQNYDVVGAISTQITSMDETIKYSKGQIISITDKSGTSNFPSPVPEPGTLSLFGGGLIAVGMLSRRRGSRAQHSSIE